ncbi:MAG: DrmB family protein [Candidatus Dormibacteria bacterium]
MSSGPVRRAHLIAPFGVGSMIIAPNGTAMLAAGLDHWYERYGEEDDSRGLDLSEFRVEEWRLERLLGVNHFREPPDFRFAERGQRIPNLNLTIPFLRFPLWHFCWRCKHLTELELVTKGRQKCPYCQREGKTAYLAQVPFVAMCEDGHLQDFPWREWVHHSATLACTRPMTLRSTGGATLANQIVECECGVPPRTLGGVVEAHPDGSTYLTGSLEPGNPYLCRGVSPQHGRTDPSTCQRAVRGSLRSASNVYFGRVVSSIYLPRTTDTVSEELRSALEIPPLSTLIHMSVQIGQVASPAMLRDANRELLEPYSDAELEEAIKLMASEVPEEETPDLTLEESDQVAFRRQEYEVLRHVRREAQLSVSQAELSRYDDQIRPYIERILLVDRLRETRVLTGFNRIYPEQPLSDDARLGQLWRRVPEWRDRWLPAYKVFGEGIFIELNLARVADWSSGTDVIQRASTVERRYGRARQDRHLQARTVAPTFLLLHTFAHLLINQLTFDCGYSTAALRERMYVSSSAEAPMAAVLIYTAAGDAEGTMGGLVRMGKPGYLEPAIFSALRSALWCSADPVCMEIGTQSGQGPDSCNLAACHNCCLVPETACEEFNRFLDRAVVVGSVGNREMGFFHGLVS